MPGTPEKQKGPAATITKQVQKLAKKNNQWQSNILPFPLIPTKARTTKLAQKREKNIQNQLNHVQPVGCGEEICLKMLFWLFLILPDYVENCLNLCPSSARRETIFGRLRAAAYDHLRSARNRLYRYHFDGNYSIFPYRLIEFLEYLFFELNGCRNNTFIILRYVDGGIPLRHPSWCFIVLLVAW